VFYRIVGQVLRWIASNEVHGLSSDIQISNFRKMSRSIIHLGNRLRPDRAALLVLHLLHIA
jgi:hypothetical protein